MTLENASYLLLGAAVAALLRNIWDYYQNTRFQNADAMGAMVNWHLGFLVAWLLGCSALIVHPDFDWYYGAIGIPLVVFSTWVFWFPVHAVLKALGLIQRRGEV
jgi:hypothetical protein